jgi:adenine/guanine/hypoxanthine permease
LARLGREVPPRRRRALFFTPLTATVPGEVAAAALVVIGAMMMTKRTARGLGRPGHRDPGVPHRRDHAVHVLHHGGCRRRCAVVRRDQGRSGKAREIGAFMGGLTVIFLVCFALNPIESRMGVH